MTALWYWALFAFLVVAVVVTFSYYRWWLATEATKLTRRIAVLQGDGDEDTISRRYWTHMRDIEAAVACLIYMQRAIREHPDRIAALMSEDVPLLDAITAVAS